MHCFSFENAATVLYNNNKVRLPRNCVLPEPFTVCCTRSDKNGFITFLKSSLTSCFSQCSVYLTEIANPLLYLATKRQTERQTHAQRLLRFRTSMQIWWRDDITVLKKIFLSTCCIVFWLVLKLAIKQTLFT